MALHHTAQGLAGLGRNGDSVLVHMQPQEVAGLQALAQSQGTSLTVNPDTGMPEAFNLGNFFTSLLPTIAGFMVGGPPGAALGLKSGSTAATLAPIAAGVATGAAVAGAKGEDVLSGALLGGLGGFGGGNLADSIGKLGAAAAPGGYTPGAVIPQGTPITTAEGMKALEGANPFFGSASTTPSLLTNSTGAATGVGAAAPMTYSQSLGQMGSGFGELLKPGGYDKFISPEIGGSAMQLGSSLGLPVLAGMQPEPFDFAAEEERRKAEENKYRGPTGSLNLSPSSGLNLGVPTLAAQGGLMQSYATGGTINTNQSSISSGGLQDLYGANDNTTATAPLSQDGYGIGRLDKLAQQGSLSKAGDMFYAAGGPVSFADGGDTGMDVDSLPSLNVNTGRQSTDVADISGSRPFGPLADYYAMMARGVHDKIPTGIPNSGMGYLYHRMLGLLDGGKSKPKSYALNVNSGQQEAQYASGGYLDGPGDGLSDSIPATIEGKQPARLADGEFVVSADVVSGLGNGSSKAGAKQLYAMMDRVRQKAHGSKRQIRKVNTKQVMPA